MQQVWGAEIADIAPGACCCCLTGNVRVQEAVRVGVTATSLVGALRIRVVRLLLFQAGVWAVNMLAAPEGGSAQGKAHMKRAVWWSVSNWQAGAMAVNVFAALQEDLQQGMGGGVVKWSVVRSCCNT